MAEKFDIETMMAEIKEDEVIDREIKMTRVSQNDIEKMVKQERTQDEAPQ